MGLKGRLRYRLHIVLCAICVGLGQSFKHIWLAN